jgi:outer membrane protein OmpA-like peptidoglycan-associated protein
LNAALDVTIPQAPSAAGLTSKSVRVTWATPTGDAVDAVVTIRNGATTVCVADAIAAKCDVVGLKSKTSYTLSVEYSNMGYSKIHSVTASTLKTPGPYKTSKILFNAYSTKFGSIGTKALWDALRNIRKHNASMIEITGAVQKTGYTGNDAKLALKRAEKIKTWFREHGVTIKIVVKRSKPVALSDIAGRQATVKLFD